MTGFRDDGISRFLPPVANLRSHDIRTSTNSGKRKFFPYNIFLSFRISTMTTQTISVGIMSAAEITFELHGGYTLSSKPSVGNNSTQVCASAARALDGVYSARLDGGSILFEGRRHQELHFVASSSQCRFTLHGVTIGVNFHWQQQESQTFAGDLKLIVGHDKVLSSQYGLIAINLIDIEDYLLSVISSEMAATSSAELLKAHAVISRSWLLASMKNSADAIAQDTTDDMQQAEDDTVNTNSDTASVIQICRWYERDAHALFDVCADDHCQRYQGLSRATSDDVRTAIEATRGQVLVDNATGKICDARFYKCCGGMTEEFENCWADRHYPYLESVRDYNDDSVIDTNVRSGQETDDTTPDLRQEAQARAWIMSAPKAYCNTRDARILSQVLNSYDLSTPDFYRWTVRYTDRELSALVSRRSGIDPGLITDLIPLRRGPSARIYRLRIVGTKATVEVGKELEIRKWLSTSHLYSSAFVVDKQQTDAGIVFTLHGAGWGHGVGLCQIGSAMMAQQGHPYTDILSHYFHNSHLSNI